MSDIQRMLDEAGAKNVYLIVADGCEFCEKMKSHMREYIDDGTVTVKQIESDDSAVRMMECVESNEIPSIIVETTDGEYVRF